MSARKVAREETDARRRAMAVLAGAPAERLDALWNDWPHKPGWSYVRAPETGLVMVRGRVGGSGAPFNLGEVTVTRAVVALESGTSGTSYCLGRDRNKAGLAALFDALWREPASRDAVEREVIAPLEEARAGRDARTRAEVAATKVDFFTMVRGDDE